VAVEMEGVQILEVAVDDDLYHLTVLDYVWVDLAVYRGIRGVFVANG
jgi:hypothetical protein